MRVTVRKSFWRAAEANQVLPHGKSTLPSGRAEHAVLVRSALDFVAGKAAPSAYRPPHPRGKAREPLMHEPTF